MKPLLTVFFILFLLGGLSARPQETRIQDPSTTIGSMVGTPTPNNGYPTHRDEAVWQESDWQPLAHTDVTYDSDGKVTSEIITYTDGEQYRYIYEGDNEHSYTYCSKYTGEDWEPFSREVSDLDPATGIEYHYIREMYIDGFWYKVMEWNAWLEFLEGRLGRRTVSEYNEETKQTEYTYRYTYTYLESGSCSSMTTEKYTDGTFVNYVKDDYSWLNELQYAQVLQSHWTGTAWLQNGKFEYNWIDDHSYIWTYFTRLNETSPWNPFLRLTDRFDERGNQVEYLQERYMNQLWTLTFGSQYILTYEGTNLTEKIAQDWQSGGLKSGSGEWVNAYRIVYSDFLNLGTGDLQSTSLQMTCYPVPAGDQLTIEIHSVDPTSKTLMLTNLRGQPIREETVSPLSSVVSWDITGLPAGIYLIRLTDPSGRNLLREIIKY